MHLDLNRLERGRLEETFEIGPGHPLLAGYDLEVRDPFALDVELTNPSSRMYVLTGEVTGTAWAACRRCLTPVAVPIDERFRVVYEEAGRDAERSDDPGDDDIVWIESGATRIEIDEEIRDRIFLETDRFPLCRPDCAGLCPVCGQNRNDARCDCAPPEGDTRWKALEGLRLGDDDGRTT